MELNLIPLLGTPQEIERGAKERTRFIETMTLELIEQALLRIDTDVWFDAEMERLYTWVNLNPVATSWILRFGLVEIKRNYHDHPTMPLDGNGTEKQKQLRKWMAREEQILAVIERVSSRWESASALKSALREVLEQVKTQQESIARRAVEDALLSVIGGLYMKPIRGAVEKYLEWEKDTELTERTHQKWVEIFGEDVMGFDSHDENPEGCEAWTSLAGPFYWKTNARSGAGISQTWGESSSGLWGSEGGSGYRYKGEYYDTTYRSLLEFRRAYFPAGIAALKSILGL